MVILHKGYSKRSIKITLNIWYRSYSSTEVVEMSLDRSRIDPYIKKLNLRFYRWNFGLVSQFIIWILLSSLNTSFYLDLISEQLWVLCSENIFDRVEEGYSLKKKTWASETSEKSLSTERDPCPRNTRYNTVKLKRNICLVWNQLILVTIELTTWQNNFCKLFHMSKVWIWSRTY